MQQSEDWSDGANAQADMILIWHTGNFDNFVMQWPIRLKPWHSKILLTFLISN